LLFNPKVHYRHNKISPHYVNKYQCISHTRRSTLHNAAFPSSLTTQFGILVQSDFLNYNIAILHIAVYTGYRSTLHT